jgi:hypothetical protein
MSRPAYTAEYHTGEPIVLKFVIHEYFLFQRHLWKVVECRLFAEKSSVKRNIYLFLTNTMKKPISS